MTRHHSKMLRAKNRRIKNLCACAKRTRTQRCRRFCVGHYIKVQSRSIAIGRGAATHSTLITWHLQDSVEFHNGRNVVRDQGVGGSNPLSPINILSRKISGADFFVVGRCGFV